MSDIKHERPYLLRADGTTGTAAATVNQHATSLNASLHHLTLAPDDMAAYRGAVLEFYGLAASTAYTYRVYRMTQDRNAAGNVVGYRYRLFGYGTVTTHSDVVGSSSAAVLADSDMIAGTTITFTVATSATTPVGEGDKWLTAFSAANPTINSPGSGTVAWLYIPDACGAHALAVDIYESGGSRAYVYGGGVT